jgi:hypothetical protein
MFKTTPQTWTHFWERPSQDEGVQWCRVAGEMSTAVTVVKETLSKVEL